MKYPEAGPRGINWNDPDFWFYENLRFSNFSLYPETEPREIILLKFRYEFQESGVVTLTKVANLCSRSIPALVPS